MKKREFYFESSDKVHKLHGLAWIPDHVKGIVQIVHGMCEYVDRYDRFAYFLCNHDLLVVGHDHLGHGKSVLNEEELGYFHEGDGSSYLIDDIHQLQMLVKEKYKNLPYFMLGHSMGSFLAREYLMLYGKELKGCIIMGTGTTPNNALNFGMNLIKAMAKVRGWSHRSDFVANLAMGSYNNSFKPNRTPYDWLTRNEEIVDRYAEDPLDNYTMTIEGFYTMMCIIKYIQSPKHIRQLPKNVPLLIVSGAKDPVGDFGHGPLEVYIAYRKHGVKDIQMKLYPGARHEILNELDHEVTDHDLLFWIEKRLKD